MFILNFIEFILRKAELYSLEWGGGMKISDLLISGAPYGGPIAVTCPQDTAKSTHSRKTPAIFIFTAAGRRLATIQV